MLPISFNDVKSAAERIAGVANRTPVITSRTLNELTGREIFLKCESFQRGGSFKFRGAYNRISRLGPEERERGVVAFSSGNHAQGVALAARLLGVPATIVMPTDAPAVKVAATRGYGAEIVTYDRMSTSRDDLAQQLAEERGLTVVPPYNDPFIMAGQGTLALELLDEVPDLDALVTQVGGGGLISGCATAATAIKPAIAVYGVEAEGADDVRQSLHAGSIVTIPPPTTIADGIRTQSPGPLTFAVIRELVRDVLIVSDAQIVEALRLMVTRLKLVVEPTGAVALAAVLAGLLPPEFRRVGVVVSGGNVDPKLLAQLVS